MAVSQDSDKNDNHARMHAQFRWAVPEHFNIAQVCCARWAQAPDGEDAQRELLCLTGAYTGTLITRQEGFSLSPGDLDEAIQVMRRLWREERVTHEGVGPVGDQLAARDVPGGPPDLRDVFRLDLALTVAAGALLVPVLRHAESRELWSNAAEIARLAEAARAGRPAGGSHLPSCRTGGGDDEPRGPDRRLRRERTRHAQRARGDPGDGRSSAAPLHVHEQGVRRAAGRADAAGRVRQAV